jgi:rare lipoprotein A
MGNSVTRHRVSRRAAYGAALAGGCLALAGCVTNDTVATRTDIGTTPEASVAALTPPPQQHVAKATPVHAPLKLHEMATPAPRLGVNYSAVGLASWYGADFHGRRTANGESFNMNALTAAHRTLPMQCTVRVTNLANHRSLLVRVNDRGPYAGNRLIDLSAQSAKLLGFYERGLAKVKIDYVGPAARVSPPRVTASAM